MIAGTATPPLDRRRNAYRDDLADERLKGLVSARRFTAGERCQIETAVAPLYEAPDWEARLATQALRGETMSVFERADGWGWVQLERDGYVGYTPIETFSPHIHPATDRVTALATFVFADPDVKSMTSHALPLNATVEVVGRRDGFAMLRQGGFISARHLVAATSFEHDFVRVAARFLGCPYRWGGKTIHGIDCSGLVQTALHATGQDCPRDSDMQLAELGVPISIEGGMDDFRRGDLVFWRGHVGIMCDGTTLLHANAYHMEVAAEPARDAFDRLLRAGSPLLGIRRLPALSGMSPVAAR